MEATTVILRLIVQTPLDHSTAVVGLDTLEMDGTCAQVHLDLCGLNRTTFFFQIIFHKLSNFWLSSLSHFTVL